MIFVPHCIFYLLPPPLLDEKRRDKVFGFPSFRPSVFPSFRHIGICTCVRNSSYSFILILLKLYKCLDHALKICMWFKYNPQFILTLFSQFELSHFDNESEPCVRNFSYSFIPILFKLYRCLYHALEICRRLRYNPQINFSHFFLNLNLVIFRVF